MRTKVNMLHQSARRFRSLSLKVYQSFLEFLMKIICYCYRSRFKATFSDALALDEWELSVDSIKDEETQLVKDLDAANVLAMKATTTELKEMTSGLLQLSLGTSSDILDIKNTARDVRSILASNSLEGENREYFKDLDLMDPTGDHNRIKREKGKLLQGSCDWIFGTVEYMDWKTGDQRNILWIRGEPGKGKSMLMLGLLDKLWDDASHSQANVSFFFFQAMNSAINSATAMIKALLWKLLNRRPNLVAKVRETFPLAQPVSKDPNAVYILHRIATYLLSLPELGTVYIVMDGLDECMIDLDLLMDLVASDSNRSGSVKWLVSSRPHYGSVDKLLSNASTICLNLDRSLGLVNYCGDVAHTVHRYIDYCLDSLYTARSRTPHTQQDDDDLEEELRKRLHAKAGDTFLWVTLVIKELSRVPRAKRAQIVDDVPSELSQLYQHMMNQVQGQHRLYVGLCYLVLTAVCAAREPLRLKDLWILSGLRDDGVAEEDIADVIDRCSCFLSQQDLRVGFVHLSARDWIMQHATASIFVTDIQCVHLRMSSLCMEIMLEKLRHDICDARKPAGKEQGDDAVVALADLAYPCSFWMSHLEYGVTDLENVTLRLVQKLLQEKFLQWLEALSLLKGLSVALPAMVQLNTLLADRTDVNELKALAKDALAFVRHHRRVIEEHALQVYDSALLFSPKGSLVRELYQSYEPTAVSLRPDFDWTWSPQLHTLQGHTGYVTDVAFSPDESLLASVSRDGTIKIWNLRNGLCVQTLLAGPADTDVTNRPKVAFGPSNGQLAAISMKRESGDAVGISELTIWNIDHGKPKVLGDHRGKILALSFRNDGCICTASSLGTVRYWSTGTTSGHTQEETCSLPWPKYQTIHDAKFSPNCHYVAWVISGSVKVFDLTSKEWLPWSGEAMTFFDHAQILELSDNLRFVIQHSQVHGRISDPDYMVDYVVKEWRLEWQPYFKQPFLQRNYNFLPAGFHAQGPSARIALREPEGSLRVVDSDGGLFLRVPGDHKSMVTFSRSGKLLALSDLESSLKIWDSSSVWTSGPLEISNTDHSIKKLIPSRDLSILMTVAVVQRAKTVINVWETVHGRCIKTFHVDNEIVSAALSWDGSVIAWAPKVTTVVPRYSSVDPGHGSLSPRYASKYKTVVVDHDRVAEIRATNNTDWTQQLIDGFSDTEDLTTLCFDKRRRHLATASRTKLRIWSVETGAVAQFLGCGAADMNPALAFSPDGHFFAEVRCQQIRLWVTSTDKWACQQTIDFDIWSQSLFKGLTFSRDSTELAIAHCTEDEENALLHVWHLSSPSSDSAGNNRWRGTRYHVRGYFDPGGDGTWFPDSEYLHTPHGRVRLVLAPRIGASTAEEEWHWILKREGKEHAKGSRTDLDAKRIKCKTELLTSQDLHASIGMNYEGLGLSSDGH